MFFSFKENTNTFLPQWFRRFCFISASTGVKYKTGKTKKKQQCQQCLPMPLFVISEEVFPMEESLRNL